jgi:hypothetical protein
VKPWVIVRKDASKILLGIRGEENSHGSSCIWPTVVSTATVDGNDDLVEMPRELSTSLAQFSDPARDVCEVLIGIRSRIDVDA